MYTDAHIHLVDLEKREPDFFNFFPPLGWTYCAASHDAAEWAHSETLRARLPPGIASFGIHPQHPVLDNADFLAQLAHDRRIQAVGEAGFDFFGDIPERVRNEKTIRIQKQCFEFQLDLAQRYTLPLLVHMRKSTDILMAYGKELRRLPAVIFHSWPGNAAEGEAFLRKGINAFFSFGTSILRCGPRTSESCARLPVDRILSETDAPWQPPHGAPYTDIAHIIPIVARIAALQNKDIQTVRGTLRLAFCRAFGVEKGHSA